MTTTKAITGVRSITHLYRGREGWTPLLYLISYEWIFLNNLLQLTNMKLFAALERALLARWRKIKVALKVNKWPLLSLKEQRLQLKKQYLESLFRKKWQKFERSIYVCSRSRFPHLGLAIIQHVSLIESDGSSESQRNKDAVGHTRLMWLAICWRYSLASHDTHTHVRLIWIVWDCSNLNTISFWTAIIKA